MQTIEEKKGVVESLIDDVNNASAIYLADYKGINVPTLSGLRSSFKEKGVHMQVVKNTLLKRVFEKCEITGLDEYLIGPTSLILADAEDPAQPAKIIVDFQKENDGFLEVKGVQMDSQNYAGDSIKDLAKMPGKRELQATIISLAMSPGANLIGYIKGPGSTIAGQIKALVEKLEKAA